MAEIISIHKDGGMAAACQGKLQIEIVRWSGEPTTEQLAQYPNSEWGVYANGKQSDEDVYGYDGSGTPIKSTPMQISIIDKVIFVGSILGGVLACLFLIGLSVY